MWKFIQIRPFDYQMPISQDQFEQEISFSNGHFLWITVNWKITICFDWPCSVVDLTEKCGCHDVAFFSSNQFRIKFFSKKLIWRNFATYMIVAVKFRNFHSTEILFSLNVYRRCEIKCPWCPKSVIEQVFQFFAQVEIAEYRWRWEIFKLHRYKIFSYFNRYLNYLLQKWNHFYFWIFIGLKLFRIEWRVW